MARRITPCLFMAIAARRIAAGIKTAIDEEGCGAIFAAAWFSDPARFIDQE